MNLETKEAAPTCAVTNDTKSPVNDREATRKFLDDFDKLDKHPHELVEMYKRIYSSDWNAWTLDVVWKSKWDYELVPRRKDPVMSEAILWRMAHKLIWSLRHGWNARSVGDVTFLGALTPQEMPPNPDPEKRKKQPKVLMTDEQFIKHLEDTQIDEPVHTTTKRTVNTYTDGMELWSEAELREFRGQQ